VNLLWSAYRTAAPVLGAMAPAARWLTSPHERALWEERLGHVTVSGGVHAWLHAASMGEALAAGALLAELAPLQPGARFHLTATTRGGRARLRQLDPNSTLAPIDSPQAIARFLAGVRPERMFLLETELWFHWLMATRAAGVPVAVVSARLSSRSVPNYRRFGAPLKGLIGGLAAVLCQSELDAERWLALGAPPARTVVVGNLKNDALPQPADDRGRARARLALEPGRPLLVLGSVRPGEITVLARAWATLPERTRALWQVVAVPRHPRVSGELREEARRAGQPLVFGGEPRGGAWRWEDRLGVLAGYYQAADVAFVGGSLGRFGGHNPLEPAACGAAVVMGPDHASQLQAMRMLLAREAVWVAGPGAPLALAFETLLEHEQPRQERQRAALAVADAARGAARRAVARLSGWGLWPVA